MNLIAYLIKRSCIGWLSAVKFSFIIWVKQLCLIELKYESFNFLFESFYNKMQSLYTILNYC